MTPSPALGLDPLRRELPLKVRGRFGLYVKANPVAEFDGEQEVWALTASIPFLLDPAGREKRVIRFVSFPEVGKVIIERKAQGFSLDLPTRDEVSGAISKKLVSHVSQAEVKLVDSIQERIVGIPQVANALNPIEEILIGAERGDPFSAVVAARRSEDKAKRYVNLLDSLGFVRVIDGRLTPGDAFKKVQAAVPDPGRLHLAILAQVSSRGLAYLRDYAHLTLLTPFIRSSNSYYLPSSYAGERISLTQERIGAYYEQFYHHKKNPLKLANHLKSLVKAEILEYDSSAQTYRGDTAIFDRFSERVAGAVG